MTNFWQALDLVEESAKVDIEYRLYYNDLGEVEFYSMEDLPGAYIKIDCQTYAEGRFDVTVVGGKLVKPAQKVFQKLVPVGTPKYDVSIVSNDEWKLKRYE